jgi:hypothetical protein
MLDSGDDSLPVKRGCAYSLSGPVTLALSGGTKKS